MGLHISNSRASQGTDLGLDLHSSSATNRRRRRQLGYSPFWWGFGFISTAWRLCLQFSPPPGLLLRLLFSSLLSPLTQTLFAPLLVVMFFLPVCCVCVCGYTNFYDDRLVGSWLGLAGRDGEERQQPGGEAGDWQPRQAISRLTLHSARCGAT